MIGIDFGLHKDCKCFNANRHMIGHVRTEYGIVFLHGLYVVLIQDFYADIDHPVNGGIKGGGRTIAAARQFIPPGLNCEIVPTNGYNLLEVWR